MCALFLYLRVSMFGLHQDNSNGGLRSKWENWCAQSDQSGELEYCRRENLRGKWYNALIGIIKTLMIE